MANPPSNVQIHLIRKGMKTGEPGADWYGDSVDAREILAGGEYVTSQSYEAALEAERIAQREAQAEADAKTRAEAKVAADALAAKLETEAKRK